MRDLSTAWALGVVAAVMVLAAARHALAALAHPEQRAGRIVQVVALGVAVGCLVAMTARLPEAGRDKAPAPVAGMP